MEVNTKLLITQAAYARKKGVSRAAITKMIRREAVRVVDIDGARLVILDDPSIV